MKAHRKAEILGMWLIGFARSFFIPWWGMLYVACLFFISAVMREDFGSGVIFGFALSFTIVAAVLAYIDAKSYVRAHRWSFWTYRKTHEGVLIGQWQLCMPPNSDADTVMNQIKGQA